MPFGLGGTEMLLVLMIVLLVFGGSRLPKLARSLGEARKEFKAFVDDDSSSAEDGRQRPESRSASRAMSSALQSRRYGQAIDQRRI